MLCEFERELQLPPFWPQTFWLIKFFFPEDPLTQAKDPSGEASPDRNWKYSLEQQRLP